MVNLYGYEEAVKDVPSGECGLEDLPVCPVIRQTIASTDSALRRVNSMYEAKNFDQPLVSRREHDTASSSTKLREQIADVRTDIQPWVQSHDHVRTHQTEIA
jgi:hypothetical protein